MNKSSIYLKKPIKNNKEEKEGILIKKRNLDAVSIFRKIAKSPPKVKKIDIFSYEKELHEKWLNAENK